ncbi:MAG: ABC transporter permease [Candidatus Melainabacteria bacterium]|nr:ABC transporter permease [Candidatus Melainabacteria bacterium]MBI3308723.1 ABC transporter permease [Candidatus Melainabacteria bacterium]
MNSTVSISIIKKMSLHFALFIELLKKELKTRYRDTLLGKLWFLLHPFMIAIALVLAKFFLMNQHEVGNVSLTNFYLLLVFWLFFVMSVQYSISSISIEHNLIPNFRFPLFFLPLAIVFSIFVTTLINIIFYFGFLFCLGKPLLGYIIGLIPVCLVALIFVSTVSILFAFVQKFLPDLRLIAPFFVRLGLVWLPIFYDLNLIPDEIKSFYKNIPFVWVILKSKEVFTESISYSIAEPAYMILYSTVLFFTALMIVIGLEKYIVGNL